MQAWCRRATLPKKLHVLAAIPSTKAMAVATKAQLGTTTRNLHWVFKIADRKATTKLLQDLGMTVLRHEEFEEGCEASCNGPYNGRWSKTMIGYGPEDSQFVLELTYNYEVKSYDVGNDYRHIVIRNKAAYHAAKQLAGAQVVDIPGASTISVTSSDGYSFHIEDQDVPQGSTAMTELCLAVSDLTKSLAFWHNFLGFHIVSQSGPGHEQVAVLSCGEGQATLRLVQLPAGETLQRGTGFGRVAFSAPGALLQQLEQDVKAAGFTVHTPYVSLDTPGKATVQVVILQDPDGHEICFVGDEGFRELSQPDPLAGKLLAEAIENDKSQEWWEETAWLRSSA